MKPVKNNLIFICSNLKNGLYAMRGTLLLSLPIVVFQLCSTLADYIYASLVSNLGVGYGAMLSIINSISMILNILIFGIVSIVGIEYANSYGKNNEKGVSRVFSQGILLGILLSLLLICIYFILPYFINKLVFVKSHKYLIDKYFQILSLSALPYCLTAVFIQVYIARKRPTILMNLNIFRLILLAAFGYLFIYGAFGYFNFKFLGAAYAFVLVTWLYFFFILYFALRDKIITVKILSLSNFNLRRIVTYIYHGMLLSSALVIEVSSHLLYTTLAGFKSQDYRSIYLFFMQTEIIFIIVPFAVSRSITAAVSYAIGGKKISEIPSILLQNYYLLMLYQVIISCLLYFFASPIIISFFGHGNFYTNNITILHEIIYSIIMIVFLESTRMVLIGYLRAVKDLVYLPFINFITFICIGGGVAAVLLFYKQVGVIALILGILSGSLSSNIFLFWRYSYSKCKHKELYV